jgi:uncharacterized membrane protein
MLDVLRGFAVLLMIVFHGAYDLNWFYFIDIDILKDPFWYWLPRFIVFLFLICVGMALSIVHKNGIKWRLVIRRLLKIGGWAFVITVVTYILFPKNYVFFGALHCIATTSFVGVIFVNRPKLSLALCLIFVISNMIFQPTLIPISKWLGVTPFDYLPFYPWFGVVLLGIYLEFMNFHKISIKPNVFIRSMEFMGKNSLKIYLLHRPILFGTFFLLYEIMSGN